MTRLWSTLLLVSSIAAVDEYCCCGCPSPCPLKTKYSCGAPPTTPCSQRSSFNQSELLSPCELLIRLRDLTESDAMHRAGFFPIGKDLATTAEASQPKSVTPARDSAHRPTGQIVSETKNISEVVNRILNRLQVKLNNGQEDITIMEHEMLDGVDVVLHSMLDGVFRTLRDFGDK